MRTMRRQLLTGLLVTVCLIVLLGVAYPLAVWGVGQLAFNHRANGSFINNSKGQVVGSSLIGQNFTDRNGNPLPQYFQPRPKVGAAEPEPDRQSGRQPLPNTRRSLVCTRPGNRQERQ